MNDPNTYGGAWAKPEDLVGQVLSDRYKVKSMLGEGGMGSVYLGEHITLRKKVAIKVLHHELCRDQTQVDRFLQEARAASMIGHENIVDIVDFGPVPGGSVFFAMEFLEGEDLSDLLRREGRIRWQRAQGLILQVIFALAAAHDKGIIHRDLKPANCFLLKRSDGRDFIKLLDFGIAKVTDNEGDGGRGLTRTGAVFGTAKYMAPEQACGETADQRTDIYAAAICLYEFLTGQVPYDGDNFMRVLSRHLTEPLTLPSTMAPDANITPAVEAVIVKALSKKPADRYQTMAEFAEAIQAIGPDGNLKNMVYEGPPQVAPQVPVQTGATMWLGPDQGGAPSQPPPSGGTVMIDPSQQGEFDPDPGTVKLGPTGWAPPGPGGDPSQPPPAYGAPPTGAPQMVGHAGSGMLANTPPPGAPGSGPISGLGTPTHPPTPETRPPTRTDTTGGDYTIFARPERSPVKMILGIAAAVVVTVGGGGAVAYMLISDDDTAKPIPSVAAKSEEPTTKPPSKPKPPQPELNPQVDEPDLTIEEDEPELGAAQGTQPPTDAPAQQQDPSQDAAAGDAGKDGESPQETIEEPPTVPSSKRSSSSRSGKRGSSKRGSSRSGSSKRGSSKKGSSKKGSTKKGTPNTPPPTGKLTSSDLSAGFGRAKSAALACSGWLPGMRITIKATIAKSGKVLSAKPSSAATSTAKCVASAVKNKASFRAHSEPFATKTWTFKK